MLPITVDSSLFFPLHFSFYLLVAPHLSSLREWFKVLFSFFYIPCLDFWEILWTGHKHTSRSLLSPCLALLPVFILSYLSFCSHRLTLLLLLMKKPRNSDKDPLDSALDLKYFTFHNLVAAKKTWSPFLSLILYSWPSSDFSWLYSTKSVSDPKAQTLSSCFGPLLRCGLGFRFSFQSVMWSQEWITQTVWQITLAIEFCNFASYHDLESVLVCLGWKSVYYKISFELGDFSQPEHT